MIHTLLIETSIANLRGYGTSNFEVTSGTGTHIQIDTMGNDARQME